MRWTTTTSNTTVKANGGWWTQPEVRVFFRIETPRPSPQQLAMQFIAEKLQVLGLAYGVPILEIKKRYRLLAREHHPDAGGDAERMKLINAAYSDLRRIIEGL
jgi:DnaJ domain